MTTGLEPVSVAGPVENWAQALGESFERFGFALVADHGVDADLIAEAEEQMRLFFALPDEVKRTYWQEGGMGQRGYTPFGTEVAKDAEIADLKEFWHIGRDLPAGHPNAPFMQDNIWPNEINGFRDTFTRLFAAFDASGQRILRGISLYLGVDPDLLDGAIDEGNSILRLLHYPPVEGAAAGAVRAGAHGDINAITLLLGAEEAGLELLNRDDEWLPVSPPPGAFAINIGDMLERLTNHRLPSTLHRVVNPSPERAAHSRYSMPFFLHFRPDFLIKTLPSCIDAEHPDRYPEPMTAQQFLEQRLREIGLG